MRASWRREKQIYWKHRRAEFWRIRVTPFPGAGRWWAIPWYIVDCESGGDYSAQNPTSTAYGAYQMLDTTYATYCTACDWSKRDQDLAAHRLYREQGSSPWACG
jgi:Transglycosylase-like domain